MASEFLRLEEPTSPTVDTAPQDPDIFPDDSYIFSSEQTPAGEAPDPLDKHLEPAERSSRRDDAIFLP